MKTLQVSLAIAIAILFNLESPAQSKRGTGERRTGKESTQKAPPVERNREPARTPAAVSSPPAQSERISRPPRGPSSPDHEMRLLRPHRPTPVSAQDGPLTRPVDLNWPPTIFVTASDPDWTYEPDPIVIVDPPGPTGPPSPPAAQRMRRPVQVDLSDCVENPDHAGYDFAERRVVSCEDTTVDLYLSHGERVGFSFIVPEDTEIKDAGEHGSVLAVTRFKPAQWAENHAVPIMIGHVYIVWSYTGDFYIVRVDEIRDQSVSIEWVWHSRLSRKEAEEHLQQGADAHEQKGAEQHTNNPESGRPSAPYFGK